MEDNLLLDAIERYNKGEMSPEEKVFFEEFRSRNPDIDQTVTEHTHFLTQLDNLGDRKSFKASLKEVEGKLKREGVINRADSRVIYLWKRYRRTIAVAASIAIFFSFFTAALVSEYTGNKKVTLITPLVDNKISRLENKLNRLENKINIATTEAVNIKPPFVANFRATGFLIDGDGFLVTNAHVVNNANNLIIENKNGDQYAAVALYVDKITDLAILKVTDSAFKKIRNLPYTLSTRPADLGDQIFTLGYPREEIVYGEGYLSSKFGYSGDTTSCQISVSANPGNSGGPVFNKSGEVIGVISSKETNADGVVFAIRSRNIINALNELKKTTSLKLPYNNSIKNLGRVQQIKKIEDCIYMVKGN